MIHPVKLNSLTHCEAQTKDINQSGSIDFEEFLKLCQAFDHPKVMFLRLDPIWNLLLLFTQNVWPCLTGPRNGCIRLQNSAKDNLHILDVIVFQSLYVQQAHWSLVPRCEAIDMLVVTRETRLAFEQLSGQMRRFQVAVSNGQEVRKV